MAVTRVAVALALTAVMNVPAAPAAAAGLCPTPFPDPRISLSAIDSIIAIGRSVQLAGNLVRNGCGIAGHTVALYLRDRPGAFTYQRAIHTGNWGSYSFVVPVDRALDALVLSAETRDYARAMSRVWHVVAAREVPPDYPSNSGCYQVGSSAQLPRPSSPPEGVSVSATVPLPEFRPGDTVPIDVAIHNGRSSALEFERFTTSTFQSLRNSRTGEYATGRPWNSEWQVAAVSVGAGETYRYRVAVLARTCQPRGVTVPIQPGTYAAVVAAKVRLSENEPWLDWVAASDAIAVMP